MQEIATIPLHPIAFPRIEEIGLFPTLEGVGAQACVLLLFALITLVALARSRRERADDRPQTGVANSVVSDARSIRTSRSSPGR